MKNLESREDIELLVNSFYDKVVKDETIGFFFKDVIKVDWDKHLPKMYSFWESILFGQMSYKGNPMAVHFPINQMEAMEKNILKDGLNYGNKPLKRISRVKMLLWPSQNLKTSPI